MVGCLSCNSAWHLWGGGRQRARHGRARRCELFTLFQSQSGAPHAKQCHLYHRCPDAAGQAILHGQLRLSLVATPVLGLTPVAVLLEHRAVS